MIDDEHVSAKSQRPYFIWDYDLTEEDLHRILQGDNEVEKAWLITRILEYAKWEDIWRYLTVDDVRENFEQLRFRWPQDRELWAYALERWSRDAQATRLADDAGVFHNHC
jgi:hypothetical protein